uniref:Solute carrier family 25 member 16 n=1 Tax=Hucho hucho TaxID=62062 RepID=A0A4W5PMU0_9TELE
LINIHGARGTVVKILLQAHSPHDKDLCVVATLRAVPKKEGFRGLYKGNGAMMVRIFPYGAIQFMAFDKYKKILSKQLGVSGHIHRPIVGSMAGMTAVICTYPLDVIRACLAYQVKGHHRYTGIRNAFQTICLKVCFFIYSDLSLYLSFSMTPYVGFLFFTFSTLKSLGLVHFPLSSPCSPLLRCLSLFPPSLLRLLYIYPLDVARRRMQLGVVLPESDECLSLNDIRCVPSQAVAFTTYELMKQTLHLN